MGEGSLGLDVVMGRSIDTEVEVEDRDKVGV